MDLVGIRRRALHRDRGRSIAPSPRNLASPTSSASRSWRATATTSSRRSPRMPWYAGPTVMEHLETVDVSGDIESRPFRLAGAMGEPAERGVSRLLRAHRQRHGAAGRRADACSPQGVLTHVAGIVTAAGQQDRATAGQSVTLLLADEIDVSRGDVLASGAAPLVSDQLAAHLVWFDDEAMLPAGAMCSNAAARHRRGDLGLEAPRRDRHHGASGRHHARPQRDRLRQSQPRPAAGLRSLSRESRSRQLHSHRSAAATAPRRRA